MNHLYRIVWNAHAACWQAVSEIAKGRGKSTTSKAGVAPPSMTDQEMGKGGEPRLRGMVLAIAAALMGLILPAAPAFAGPEGGSVSAGSASISQSGNTTTINQSSDRAAINWNSFSVGKDEAVRFNQPSNTSATLNRVTGAESSQIMGSLSANGHVFILNPNGVLFGAGAQVNVGGIVATTLGMSDDDFMSGKINLQGESVQGVTNDGDITTTEGGTVVLIAPEVTNNGTISAAQGSVVLAGASSLTQGATTTPAAAPASAPAASTPTATSTSTVAPAVEATTATATPATSAPAAVATVTTPAPETATPVAATVASAPAPEASAQIATGGGNTSNNFTVRLQDGSLVGYTIDKGAVNALVNNGGLISAPGGQVILTAQGRDSLSKATVNHTGVIEAGTTTSRNGVVELLADMNVGTVNLNGSINAAAVAPIVAVAPAISTPALQGGFVETSAATVNVGGNAKVTTAGNAQSGIKTGTWLIDPFNFVVAPTGGNITGELLNIALGINDVKISTVQSSMATFSPYAGQAEGDGDIFINDSVVWNANKLVLSADRNIYINKDMHGSGGAQLSLEFGQATTDGAGADYYLNQTKINLGTGSNFSTKQGSSSGRIEYYVINELGIAGDTSQSTLQGIKNSLNQNFALGSDIDASGSSAWNGGKGFQPIGQFSATYTGAFQGLGHSIDQLYIYRPAELEIGLFGSTTNAHIRDVGISNANISGGARVGGLIGMMRWGSQVRNSYTSGLVSGVSEIDGVENRIGGFTAGHQIGGMVGVMSPYYYYGAGPCGSCVSIDRSYSSANVNGVFELGGLVGFTDQGVLRNSYATGNVSGNAYTSSNPGPEIGGLVGGWFNSSLMTNTYSTGRVVGDGRAVGGLIGEQRGAEPTSSYWSSENSPLAGGAGTAVSNADLKTISTFDGWDFTNVWQMSPTTGLPELRAAPRTYLASDFNGVLIGGIRYYFVSDLTQLQAMSTNLSRNYALNRDIDASPTATWNGGLGFAPIGTDISPFSGVFDGFGHSISNLMINRLGWVGLFGFSTGDITSLNLENVSISAPGGTHAGAIVGGMQGTLSDSSASGQITNLVGSSSVGGLVGSLGPTGKILKSHSSVDVVANHAAGGLVGYQFGLVEDSYATGDVSQAGYMAGGLVGINNGVINRSYSTGSVTGGWYKGGLVGYAGRDAPSTITNSYWNTETSGLAGSSGGGTGITTAEMQQQATFAGWDFSNTWAINEGNAFPTLLAFAAPAPAPAPAPAADSGTGSNPGIEVTASAPVKPALSVASNSPSNSNYVTPVQPRGGENAAVAIDVLCRTFAICNGLIKVDSGGIDDGSKLWDGGVGFVQDVGVGLVEGSLAPSVIAEIIERSALAQGKLSDSLFGMLNNKNLNLTNVDRRALQSVLSKDSRAWYTKARLAKSTVASSTSIALGINGVLAVFSNAYEAQKLMLEIDELFSKNPELKSKLPDDVLDLFIKNVFKDVAVGSTAIIITNWVGSKFGELAKKSVGYSFGIAVGVLSNPETGGEASTQSLPLNPKDAVSWAKSNLEFSSSVESRCGANSACIEAAVSVSNNSPMTGMWEFYSIKRDYIRAVGGDARAYDWVDKFRKSSDGNRMLPIFDAIRNTI